LPDTVVKILKLKSGDEVEIVLRGERMFEVERDRSRERALARLRALKKPLPKGFRFDRDEANARQSVLRYKYPDLCLRCR
jgi:antitoxin MazE